MHALKTRISRALTVFSKNTNTIQTTQQYNTIIYFQWGTVVIKNQLKYKISMVVWHINYIQIEYKNDKQDDWVMLRCITKTCLYNFDPVKPHFHTYISYISYFFSKHRLWVLVRTASVLEFLSKIFHILLVNFPIYLNRLGFVMDRKWTALHQHS